MTAHPMRGESAKTSSGKKSGSDGRIKIAAIVGTTLESYDFFLYGTAAALVFNSQFFPSMNSAAATLASFSTLAVGFLARPVGGLIFGHFGDRIGRKSTLMVSLLLMGVGSTLIGLVPNYDSIGLWAPVMLVLLRLIQGIGLGGESAGATLLSMEHAPAGHANRYAGYAQMGTPLGLVAANVVFLITSTSMPESAFISWGWRIPFLLSAVLVGVGMVIRIAINETPSFKVAVSERQRRKFPLAGAVRNDPVRTILTLAAVLANSAVSYVFMVFSLSYGTKNLGYDRQFLVLCVTAAAIAWASTIPFWTRIADRYGRRAMFTGGSVGLIVWSMAFLSIIDLGSDVATLMAFLVMGLVVSVTHCVQTSIIADAFPVQVRYSGTTLVFQGAAVLGGGFAPMIATALLASTGSSIGVTWYMVAISGVSLVGAVALFRRVPGEGNGASDLAIQAAFDGDGTGSRAQ